MVSERGSWLGRLSPSPIVPFRRVLVPLCGLLILLISAVLWAQTGGKAAPDLSPYPWVYLRDDAPSGPGEGLAEIIAVGDVMVGRGVSGEPFDEVRSWLRGADLVVGNLESVVAEVPVPRDSETGSAAARYLLHAPPSMVGALQDAGFSVLGLANNHALDLGPLGLKEAAANLERAGIDVIGAGPSEEDALKPVLVEVRGVRLAVLAVNAVPTPEEGWQRAGWTSAVWDRNRAVEAVRAAKNRADAVLVSVHWGYEYQRIVDPAQRDAAEALLEAGADLIIGHHPHIVQALEIDGERVVAYSLGNFVFDQEQGAARWGLALRAYFDGTGLRAVQALPVWAGSRPRLMELEDAASLLEHVTPTARRLQFVCDGRGCRQLDVMRRGAEETGSGVFWGGEIDLTGDGTPEHVRRAGNQVTIYESGVAVWNSPADWHVVDLALGDPNGDGRSDVMLALWKRGLDGLEPADPEKENALRSRPFIVGFRGGRYRTLWGGSAVAHPMDELELGDVTGDGDEELVVLEQAESGLRAVSVWRWHGWGFSLVWRSSPRSYRDLAVTGDGTISVAID